MPFTDINQRTHFDQCSLNILEQLQVEFRHRLQPAFEVGDQIRLMQKFCAILGIALDHDRGQNLRASEPATEADQLREFFIVHFIHCLLDAVLGAIEFLTHADPIPFVRRFGDRLGMGGDGITHSNPLGQRQDSLANLLHRGRVLRLHRNEAIRDHRAKQESDPGTFREITPLVVADIFAPVHPAQFVQRAENLIRQRYDYVIDLFRQLFNIDVFRGFGGPCTQGQTRHDADGQFKNSSEWDHRDASTVDFAFVFRINESP